MRIVTNFIFVSCAFCTFLSTIVVKYVGRSQGRPHPEYLALAVTIFICLLFRGNLCKETNFLQDWEEVVETKRSSCLFWNSRLATFKLHGPFLEIEITLIMENTKP